MLNDCKKSYDAFITNERYQEFSSIVKEYCYEMYVEYENYGLKLVSYDWNIRAQRILQNQVRIQEDEWDEIMSNLETLPEEFLDVETLEKIKITQSLKQQLENEAKKLKKIIPTDKHKAITYEELDMLHAQMSDCKIVLKDEAYVRSLLETTRELSQRFGNLMSNKGSVDEFKNLTEELEKHPISMADLLSKTRDILEKSNNVALRLRILKESAGRNKIDKSKAEQFLNDYKTCEFSLDDAENLIKDLDLGFEIISGGLEIIEKPDITIEELNILSGKLSNLHIYMGTDEKNLKTKI